MTEPETRRIAWRCRRGHLELDLVLRRFLQETYPSLNGDQRASFVRVLALPDPVLMRVIDRTRAVSSEDGLDAGMQDILGRLTHTAAPTP